MRQRIEVTQDHINRGEINCANLCPIALALNDLGFLAAEVQDEAIDLDWEEEDIPLVYLPAVASAFIRSFDAGEPVSPVSFEISIPEEALSLAAGVMEGVQP